MPPPAKGRFPQTAGERGLRHEHVSIFLCLPGRREQEASGEEVFSPQWSGFRCSSAIALEETMKSLLRREAAASWQKGLIPKGVQARTSGA